MGKFHLRIRRGNRNQEALLLGLAAASYFFWLFHSYAVRNFLKTVLRLADKFLW